MKILTIPDTYTEYLSLVKQQLWVGEGGVAVWDTLFYAKMFHYVMRTRCPLFYFAETEEERLAYTSWSGIIPVPTRENKRANSWLYAGAMVHEFTHALFEYETYFDQISYLDLERIFGICEMLASNETEMYINQRVEGFRENTRVVLPRTWYDCWLSIRKDGKLPSVPKLLGVRRSWLSDDSLDELFIQGPEDKPVSEYIEGFRKNNPRWLAARFDKLRTMARLVTSLPKGLRPFSYDQYLNSLSLRDAMEYPQELEKNVYYRKQLLLHAQNMSRMVGLPEEKIPESFLELGSWSKYMEKQKFVF